MVLLERMCSFLHIIHTNIDLHRDDIINENKKKNKSNQKRKDDSNNNNNEREGYLEVLIVGGGPVGLMSAIESYRNGGAVTVVEKRSEYTRNTWFDLGK